MAKYTPEQAARIAELLEDGMTLAWIADDLGVKLKGVYKHIRHKADPHLTELMRRNANDFVKVWSSIFHTPREFEIHCMIRPKEMNR